MSPLRILVIVALLYVGYRLLTGGRRKADRNDATPPGGRDPGGPVQDVLVEDPVCHSLVPKQQAIHLNHNGTMVHFCSEKCCQAFIAEHDRER